MSTELFSLAGRTALITGSSQGIGFALAEGLIEAGARVIMNGRDPAKLASAATPLGAEHLAFDVTDHASVRKAVDGYEANHGAIDILINNAGMQHRGPLEEFSSEDFERVIATNLTSVFNVGQAVARHMIGRGAGRIINIASVMSKLSRPGVTPYTASKGGVSNLTMGMATEWAPKGLNVNAIAPGYFDTPLNAALVADQDFTAWIAKRTPQGRWGRLPELVGAAVFLSSDASSFVNGQTLFVDGGMTACL